MPCKDSKLSNSETLTIIKENYESYSSLGIGEPWNDNHIWLKLDNLKNQGLLNVKDIRNNDIWKKQVQNHIINSSMARIL